MVQRTAPEGTTAVDGKGRSRTPRQDDVPEPGHHSPGIENSVPLAVATGARFLLSSRSPLERSVRPGRNLKFRASARSRRLIEILRNHFLRRLKGVERLQVVPGKNRRDQHSLWRLILPIDLDDMRVGQVAIENENRSFPILRVE